MRQEATTEIYIRQSTEGEIMGVFNNYFPLGLGTSRLPISGPDDTEGIEKSVRMILKALDSGINYIDTSYPYSAGMAHTALKTAFAQTKKLYGVTVKVMHDMDKTADDTIKRVEFQLDAMGVDKAAFFVCWTIPSYEVFQAIMCKGGVYEGALKLKDEGIIDHICCSIHASQSDSIKIIESGAFEGATVSHSLLSAIQTIPVLDAALRSNVDIAVMNPLGGGIIAQNQEFFSFSQSEGENTITAALRFAYSHPAVKLILSGISREGELEENINAIVNPSSENNIGRQLRVLENIRSIKNFCVNCHYCDGCPAGIPISELMSERNKLLFNPITSYSRSDPELTRNINLFYNHTHLGADEWFPDSSENPCIDCGQCEEKCTQKLEIRKSISDTYNRAKTSGFSMQAHKERLNELLIGKNYRRVGLYPNGGFANMIIEQYSHFFGEPDFEWLQFNSDPKMWGQYTGGLLIHSPREISELKPDLVIVCTYKYDKEIYESLGHHESEGIKITKLHRENDVPWVF